VDNRSPYFSADRPDSEYIDFFVVNREKFLPFELTETMEIWGSKLEVFFQ